MDKKFPLICFFLLSTCAVFAQTPAENLQNGVEVYNAMKTYIHDLTAQSITAENIVDIKARVDKGVAFMEKTIKEGNSDEIKTARYFKTNFYNEYAFALGMKGDIAGSYAAYNSIATQMSAYSSSDFPLRYAYFGKNFIIKWEDFAASQAEFLTGFSEITYNKESYSISADYARKAIAHPNASDWFRYIAINKLLDVAQKSPATVPETERLDLAVRAAKAYDVLSEQNKEIVAKNNYPSVLRVSEMLLMDALAKGNLETVNRCVEVLPILIKVGKTDAQALHMMELCFKNNPTTSRAFAEMSEAHARKMKPTESVRANAVGVAAVDRMAALTSVTDCNGIAQIAAQYRFWGRTDKDKEWMKKSENCQSERIKAEKRAAKAAKKSNSSFNVYTGVYVLPLLATNPKRDYGATLNFGGRNMMLEVSYLKIKQKKENIFDLWINEVEGSDQDNLSRWNGYYAHVQPKFMKKQSYWGLLLGKAEKQFDPLAVNCLNDATSTYETVTFEPKVDQYICMANFGSMLLGKGFGIDMYMGIGANYSRFDAGTAIDRNLYTIDNPLLENRKDTYWGLILRMGFTMGLNFGKGNMR